MEPEPKSMGTYQKGRLKGLDEVEMRKLAHKNTKEALERANSENPPSYENNSSKHRDKSGRLGAPRPHVNARATASNGYQQTIHIKIDGGIEEKPPENPKYWVTLTYISTHEPRQRMNINKLCILSYALGIESSSNYQLW
ncbi:hypothetical protein PENSTE_c021G06153 [Penicillium steckii]|uniref:Uncharacterized protein n=1 Tax=Penicillium steckii TaxID=303698 RepID=A0A1V6ST73_9EURO|nr:hypothetical protein PENSTE_c021G06153 [Penicillium steckii]